MTTKFRLGRVLVNSATDTVFKLSNIDVGNLIDFKLSFFDIDTFKGSGASAKTIAGWSSLVDGVEATRTEPFVQQILDTFYTESNGTNGITPKFDNTSVLIRRSILPRITAFTNATPGVVTLNAAVSTFFDIGDQVSCTNIVETGAGETLNQVFKIATITGNTFTTTKSTSGFKVFSSVSSKSSYCTLDKRTDGSTIKKNQQIRKFSTVVVVAGSALAVKFNGRNVYFEYELIGDARVFTNT